MHPVMALVGRPNVGKSTLFNRLTKSHNALVVDEPGITRDRLYGPGKVGDKPFIVIDTAGLSGNDFKLDTLMAEQAMVAIEEADTVLFIVDGRDGLTATDENIAAELRRHNKKICLVINKTEGVDLVTASAEFHALGFAEMYATSASHGHGISSLVDGVLQDFPEIDEEEEQEKRIKVGIIGRPNVGKSTLVNRMLGEERVLALDMPGTTRDSIYIPFERDGEKYTLIDTAGVRRRKNITETIEKFSIVKTLKAIDESNVVIMVIDAHQDIGHQDATLLGYIIEKGRSLIIAVNKWDGLDADKRAIIKSEIDRKLAFVSFSEIHFISALHGTGVGELYDSILQAYQSATRTLSTNELTQMLEHAVTVHQPPLVHGRRIKLRYAHQGGRNPPVIVIHGNQADAVTKTYRRYLEKTFIDLLKLKGTPLRLEFKKGKNPFAESKSGKPTTSREEKRKRQLKLSKGAKQVRAGDKGKGKR